MKAADSAAAADPVKEFALLVERGTLEAVALVTAAAVDEAGVEAVTKLNCKGSRA